jgi:hypothetical protein
MAKKRDDVVPTWPGSGFVAAGTVVRYGGHLWRAVRAGAGKPRIQSPQWERIETTSGDNEK